MSPFIIVVCKKWPENSRALASSVQVGDNWSSTSSELLTDLQDCSLSRLCTGTSTKGDGVKLVLYDKISFLGKMVC
jgi:hypothetical protein